MTWPWIVAVVTLWLFALTLAVLVLGLLRRMSEFLETAQSRLTESDVPPDFGGLLPGSPVPAFEARTEAGGRVRAAELLETPTLLLFADPGCEPCEDLLRSMEGTHGHIDGVPYLIVAEGTLDVSDFPVPADAEVVYQSGGDVSISFMNIATPQAFAIRKGRIVGKSVPQSLQDLERLATLIKEGGDREDELGPATGVGKIEEVAER